LARKELVGKLQETHSLPGASSNAGVIPCIKLRKREIGSDFQLYAAPFA
jgi:hypothetical protein